MREVGIRELKVQASEIVRRVRERKMRYVITYRGRPVAALGPVEPQLSGAPAPDPEAWDELARLGEAIAEGWTAPRSSVELLSASRR